MAALHPGVRRLITPAAFGLVAALLGFPTAQAQAQSAPSFDCFKASTPVEHLICNDPVLARYDMGLAEAFSEARKAATPAVSKAVLADQRQWLKDRLSACAIPVRGAAPVVPQSWPMTACLVNQYEQRLAALDALPADEPSMVPEEVKAEAGYVHPACLLYASGNDAQEGQQPAPVDIHSCNAAYDHIVLQYAGDEGGDLSAEGMTEGFYTWTAFYKLGSFDDGRQAAILAYNGGGSGTFSSIVTYRIDQQGRLVVENGGLGGDRCNGGLSSGGVANNTLKVDQYITAADVGLLIGLPESVSNEMDFCAICCFGSLNNRVSWPAHKPAQARAESFSPSPDALAPISPDASPAQRCLQQVMAGTFGPSPTALSIPHLQALKAPILACIQASATEGRGRGASQ